MSHTLPMRILERSRDLKANLKLLREREPDPAMLPVPRFESSPALSIVLACALAGVVLLGLFPNIVVSLAMQAVPLMK